MIVVTGATGGLGHAVVEQLLARVPADRVGASVRDPDRARDLADRGVRVRRGDFADPGTLAAAFEGADQVLLVSANDVGGRLVGMHEDAITAAVDAGVQRVVYTSQVGAVAGAGSSFAPARDHAATEAALAASGLAWTSLRNGFYTWSALQLLQQGLQTGVWATPAGGPVAWTSRDDLAEAAAVVLVDGGLDGATPPLTAAAAADLDELVAAASRASGRQVRHEVVTDAQYRDGLVAEGTPAVSADMLVGTFEAMRAGDFAGVDPLLERLLGRPPTTLADALRRELAEAA